MRRVPGIYEGAEEMQMVFRSRDAIASEACAFARSESEGSGAPGNAGLARPSGGGEPPSHAADGLRDHPEACCISLRSEMRASRRSTGGLFSAPGPRFRDAIAHRRQPAPGGRSLVTSRWSPGPSECGMPSTRGDRPPPHHPGCLRKAPLGEQGEGRLVDASILVKD